MNEFLTLAVVGLGTYALRSAFLVGRDARPPAALDRLLPHIAPAVLAAIAAPSLLAPRGIISAEETLPALVAAAATWLLWARTERMPLALIGGLGLWWAIEAVLP
ncbi:AzlD domain-containing protein [Agromyces sp. ZXT2-6]|uniref:AzlD domain-containing protein n=1 Tax=Agromyces sp. ZXT2-6 TaxID=3461153 RepID=UPI00405527A6